MSWNDFVGKPYTREQFAARVAALHWVPEVWDPVNSNEPEGIVLHNTASPTLAQWAESGSNYEARIRNLKSYYQGLRWNGGPHLFISRDWITEFNALTERGTHSPSFNATHFGIEMVGDYDREPFNSGDGAKVRDNAVFAMAMLCKKFDWDPAKVIILHKEDPKTTHDCPGKFVVKTDIIARVKAVMAGAAPPAAPVDGKPDAPPTWKAPDHPAFKDDPKAAGVRRTNITATVFGGKGDEQTGAYGDFLPDRPGVALPYKFDKKLERPLVRVWKDTRSVICGIVDVGPWNISDKDYVLGGARPLSEGQMSRKVKAQNNKVPTNDAGIDLTPGAALTIGLDGKGKVDWEFISDTEAEDHALPIPDPEAPIATPTPAEPMHGAAGVDIEVLQRKLKDMGFHEVGDIDGKWGGKTAAAIAAFKNDRHLDGEPVIDDLLKEEIAVAESEGWKRSIALARSQATEARVAEKAPEIKPVQTNRAMGLWGTITGFLALVGDAASSYSKDAFSWLDQAKGYLHDVPGWVWIILFVAICLAFYYNARKGAAGIVDSVRSGEHN